MASDHYIAQYIIDDLGALLRRACATLHGHDVEQLTFAFEAAAPEARTRVSSSVQLSFIASERLSASGRMNGNEGAAGSDTAVEAWSVGRTAAYCPTLRPLAYRCG